MLKFVDLRLALKCVEKKDALIFREAEVGRDFGELGVGEFFFASEFLVERDGFRGGGIGRAIFFVFLGGGPID